MDGADRQQPWQPQQGLHEVKDSCGVLQGQDTRLAKHAPLSSTPNSTLIHKGLWIPQLSGHNPVALAGYFRSTMLNLLRKYPVLTFVLLTLTLQCAIMGYVKWKLGQHPGGATIHEDEEAHMVFRLRGFGPLLFAVLITALIEGRAGLSNLFAAYFKWRVPARWYLLAVSWKFLFTYIGVAGLVLLGIREWPGWFSGDGLPGLQKAFGEFVKNFGFVAGIAFVEETAWMKFSVTRMQERYSALRSCLIVGVCWGLWYLPMLLVGEGVPNGYPVLVFITSMICLTIFLGWTYNMTRSGLVLMIMQIVSNTAFFIMPVLPEWHALDATYVTSFVVVNLLSATTIVLVFGGKELGSRPRARWSEGMPAVAAPPALEPEPAKA